MKLTTWERVIVADTIAQQTGDMRTIRQCVALLDLVEFPDSERAEIELKAADGGFGWRETGREWDIDLTAEQTAALKTWLEARQWVALDGRKALALLGKFGGQ